jgi:hypothetical protein
MVELLIAIVVVLALCAGLLEVTSITRIHTDRLVEARKDAGMSSLLDTEPSHPVGVEPGYIADWQCGPSPSDIGDGKRMTMDDSYNDASVAAFNAAFVEKAGGTPEGWSVMNGVPANRIRGLRNTFAPSAMFGLVYADSRADINLQSPEYSLIYGLLYRPEDGHMEVKSDAWMTWTKGIY